MSEPIRKGVVVVMLSRQRRVRHLAVQSNAFDPIGPICRNGGDLPVVGNFHDFEGIPICLRCEAEVGLLASAIRVARYGHGV